MVLRVDAQSQGVHQAESGQEENRKRLIFGDVSDPDKDNFFQELLSGCNNVHTPLSEDRKVESLVTKC